MALPSHKEIMSGIGKTPDEKKKKTIPSHEEIMGQQKPQIAPTAPKATPVVQKESGFLGGVKSAVSSVAKFATRTGVEAANLAASTIDFIGDFLAGQSEKAIRRPGLQAGPLANIQVGQETEARAQQADRWKKFYESTGGAATENVKTFAKGLRNLEFIQPTKEWQEASIKDKFTKNLPETVANIGPGVVASLGSFVLNPVLGFTLAMGSTADEIKTIGLENGLDEEKADSVALGTGLLVGFLEKLVPDEVLSPVQKREFLGAVARRVFKTGLKEAGTEVVQEDIQILVEKVLGEDMGMDDVAARNLMAGFGGFLGGSGMQTMVSFVNNMRSGDIGGITPKDMAKIEEAEKAPQVPPEPVEPESVAVNDLKAIIENEVATINTAQNLDTKGITEIEEQVSQKGATEVKLLADDDTSGEYVKLGYEIAGKTSDGVVVMKKTIEAQEAIEKQSTQATENESDVLSEIPESVQEEASQEWEEKYAERYENISSTVSELETRAKEGSKEERVQLEKEIDSLNSRLVDMENEFVDNWRQSNIGILKLESQIKEEIGKNQQKAEEALSQIWVEMEVAEAGDRIFVEDPNSSEATIKGVSSTFPSWVPEDLRSRELFDNVMVNVGTLLDNPRYPSGNRPKQRALLNAVMDELDSRAGINTSDIRTGIMELYENQTESRTTEDQKGVRRSTERSKKSPSKKAKKEVEDTKSSDTAGFADTDLFPAIPILTQAKNRDEQIIPFPEMVGLAKELMQKYPVVTTKPGRMFGGQVRGMFVAEEGGQIKLNANLFTDAEQAAKTLAHEIGHLVDYLPDNFMSRGNLLGRLATLSKHMKGVYGNLTNKKVRNELIDLSTKWRGKFELKGGGSYDRYRRSSPELYADAISVLFNDPKRLQLEAPTFWEGFITYLDRKPEVKENLFAVWDLLHEPQDVILERRLSQIYEGYAEAKAKRESILEEELPRQSIIGRLMQQHVTRFDPIYRKMKGASEDNGIITSPKQKLRMQLEEMQMRRNEAYLYIDDIIKDVNTPLEKIGLTEDDLGVLLKLERNLGDRKDIANPYGLQGQYSQETLEYFGTYLQKRRGISPEQFQVLHQIAKRFREMTFSKVVEATKVGIYSKEFFEETAKPNKDTYATFQVIEYIHDNYVGAGIKQAIGTVKPIENPVVSTILKSMAVVEQIELQKGKLAVIEQLQENFPDEITPSKPIKPKGVRIGWKPVKNMAALEYYNDGKITAVDIDPYIAKMFEFYTPGEIHNIVKASGAFNRIFKPIVTTYNLSWGFYSNILRDTKRTYKNLGAILPKVGDKQGMSVFEFLNTWLHSIPQAAKFQKNETTPLLREALKDKAFSTSFSSFDTTANEAEWMKPILKRYSKLADDPKGTSFRNSMLAPIRKILRGIEFAGGTLETTTKLAGYQIVKRRVKDSKEAGFITRNYVGTPNYIDGGTQKQIDNNVFVFSNVMIQAVRTDAEIATNPQTRAGYWYRTMLVDIFPKMLMLAGVAGLMGEKVKEILDKATEYDKTNYLIVPLGVRENGKANYFRIPQDETGRLFSAIVWKLGSFINGDLKKPEQIAQLGAGYIPSMTPIWEVAGGWMNVVQGRNPYDNYRGRLVVDDITWKAGGLPVFMKLIQWTSNSLGMSQFTTYSDETDTTFDLIMKYTPILNRAFKSTDFGLNEKEQEVRKQLDQESARKLLKEREILQGYIDNAKKNPGQAGDLRDELVREVIGEGTLSSDDKRRRTNLLKKFDIGVLHGSVSRELDSLIEANTNDYKIELLKLYKDSLPDSEYKSLIQVAKENKVISDELMKRLRSNELVSTESVIRSVAGLIDSIQLVPEVNASDGDKIITSMAIEGERLITFYKGKDGELSSKNTEITDRHDGPLSFLGKIIGGIGTSLGLGEMNISEILKYKNKDQVKAELIAKTEEMQGVVEDPPIKQDLDKEKEFKKKPAPLYRIAKAAPPKSEKSVRENVPEVEKALRDTNIYSRDVLAYALATIEHETAQAMKPVNEGWFNDEKYGYEPGFTGKSEARRRGYSGGEDYYGRGLIQLTHDYNYKDYGKLIGEDLYNHPELANDKTIAAKVLAEFFKKTGIDDLVNEGKYVEARQKVNPDNKGEMVADTAEKYRKLFD